MIILNAKPGLRTDRSANFHNQNAIFTAISSIIITDSHLIICDHAQIRFNYKSSKQQLLGSQSVRA